MNASSAVNPRTYLWALRILAVALAPLMGLAISSATDGRSPVAAMVATIAWGAAIGCLVIDLVVPSPLGLTLLRLVLPATVPAAVVALTLGATPAWGVPALAVAVLATLVAFTAESAEAMVQGSAYGDEQRLPLRVPAALLPPMALSWMLWCAAVLAAVLLLGARQWVLGSVTTSAAGLFSWLLMRRFHRFSLRWLVVVPAGVVVHDPVVLGETLMLQRANVTLARLAPADTQAADLTGPAAGHALEITVREMALAVLAATQAAPKGQALHVQSLLVAPSRPGRALRAMAAAKVPVG